jgi:hypothetical protein
MQHSDRGSYGRRQEAAKGAPVVGRLGWLPPKGGVRAVEVLELFD